MLATSGGNISAIAVELGQRFPIFNACINNTRGRESRNSSNPSSVKKNTKKRKSNSNTQDALSGSTTKIGRHSKSVIYKDLVIIPNPDTKQVLSHSSKVKLEERELIIHEFHFNKGWSSLELQENIKKTQLPKTFHLRS